MNLSNFNTSYVTVQPRVSRIALQRGTNFNTSYVTVQPYGGLVRQAPNKFQYILCYGSTKGLYLLNYFDLSFQYILCYGSTHRG